MPFLYLTPTISFEPRLASHVHHSWLIHEKQTLVVLGFIIYSLETPYVNILSSLGAEL